MLNLKLALREKKLKGDSGAEVIKRFFQYEKKELEKTKYDLLERVSKVLDEEDNFYAYEKMLYRKRSR